jgi:hypothetical protein
VVEINSSTFGISWEGQESNDKFEITQVNVDVDFVETAGMNLAAGRDFDINRASDTTAYMINEAASTRMGWTPQEAIGKLVKLWDAEGSVVGVVEDFHFKRITKVIEPIIFRYQPNVGYSGLLVKTRPGLNREAIANIERVYKKYEDQATFTYEFVDEALENQYRAEQNTGRIVLYFSCLTIFVSCLGLLGLTTYTAEQRKKEIGIRKVLGARVITIVGLLSNDFLKLVLIAILVATPLAWSIMSGWLENFAYRILLEWWMFLLAGVLMITVAVVVVSLQAMKAAMANPVKNLRSE